MSSPLFEPITLPSGATLPNRLALAPLTNQQSDDDGVLSADEERWLLRRARGGFGLVETCAAHVAEDGKGFDGQLGAFDDRLLPRLVELARGLREAGALGVVQLYHGGVRAPSRLTGSQPWSASSFTEDRAGFEVPREASEAQIEGVIERFGAAAERSAKAGFGGVELHAAHGYLLSQFLSRTMNQRTDRWGGSLENRARLVLACLRAARARTPKGFTVGARLSPEDFGFAHGLDVDETVDVARMLVDEGLDFVHLSLWDHTKNTQKYPERHALELFRPAIPARVPIVAAGKVWTRVEAEALLDRGADVIALGRAAILNPEWPTLARDPAWQPTRPPLSPEAYAALDLGPRFVTYLQRFKDMVAPA
jgi:2,4-dienoyl-CoA reductase-like NADH-dependent reductase (Old Yellow Enzyme family)